MPVYEHTVKEGETLSELSKRYYRDAKYYPYLAKHNSIQNPDLIQIGQKIKIPIYLIAGSSNNGNAPTLNLVRVSSSAITPQAPSFPILLTESANKPGYDRNNPLQRANDMKYRNPGGPDDSGFDFDTYGKIHQMCTADRAPHGLLYKSDDELFTIMQDMCTTWFSSGDLQTNIIQMIAHFKGNTGTDYNSPILNREVKVHPSMVEFIDTCRRELTQFLKSTNPIGKITAALKITRPNRLYFSRWQDKVRGGLTIAVNDTTAFRVEIQSYSLNSNQKYSAKLFAAIYDHFGLDKPDIPKFPVFEFDGFRAWFILQHLRGYKPFITVMENEFDISDTL
jgi:hypothetical protein